MSTKTSLIQPAGHLRSDVWGGTSDVRTIAGERGMRRFSNAKRLLQLCFVCLWLGLLAGFVIITPVLAVPITLDQTFGPGEYGTFYPLATIDPGDSLSGTLTVFGSNNTTATAIAEIDFNGSASTLTSAFTIPGADSSSLAVNFDSNVTGLPPTLYNISSGAGFTSAKSTYPDGAYYPTGTAAPVFGIAALPDNFRPARVSFSGELTRATPNSVPGAAFQSRN
jgi:hypothetical protein